MEGDIVLFRMPLGGKRNVPFKLLRRFAHDFDSFRPIPSGCDTLCRPAKLTVCRLGGHSIAARRILAKSAKIHARIDRNLAEYGRIPVRSQFVTNEMHSGRSTRGGDRV